MSGAERDWTSTLGTVGALASFGTDGSGELYHLGKDPEERNNLMAGGKRPSVIRRLRQML